MELPGSFLSAKTGRSKVFDERQITTQLRRSAPYNPARILEVASICKSRGRWPVYPASLVQQVSRGSLNLPPILSHTWAPVRFIPEEPLCCLDSPDPGDAAIR
jgi:hypothetical protein